MTSHHIRSKVSDVYARANTSTFTGFGSLPQPPQAFFVDTFVVVVGVGLLTSVATLSTFDTALPAFALEISEAGLLESLFDFAISGLRTVVFFLGRAAKHMEQFLAPKALM